MADIKKTLEIKKDKVEATVKEKAGKITGDKKMELEKLEGLLIPLSEYWFSMDQQNFDGENTEFNRNCVNLLSQLKNFIHIPKNAFDLMKKDNSVQTTLTSLPNLINFKASKDLLEAALKPGGKILLEDQKRSFASDLTSSPLELINRNFTRQNNNLKKLINLRSDPVIIELIYSKKN